MTARSTAPHVRQNQRGMSLLEVLAAMVILSLGATVAFTWFNQSASALSQVKNQEAELLAQNEALEYLQHINPDQQPTGQVDMPDYQIEWRSQPVHQPVKSVTDLGTAAGYTVSLSQLDVVLRKKDNRQQEWVKFKLTLAGYTQSESSARSFFGSGGGGQP
jgi:prepilin-type N-terminal cleavage/methylation domain-containing protein